MATENKTSLLVTELANPEKLVDLRDQWHYEDDKGASDHANEPIPEQNIQPELPYIPSPW